MSVTGLITQQIKALACGRTTAVQVAAWADALLFLPNCKRKKNGFTWNGLVYWNRPYPGQNCAAPPVNMTSRAPNFPMSPQSPCASAALIVRKGRRLYAGPPPISMMHKPVMTTIHFQKKLIPGCNLPMGWTARVACFFPMRKSPSGSPPMKRRSRLPCASRCSRPPSAL